jgi:hypothetical protein
MQSQTITVGSQTEIHVELKESIGMPDEVTVV